MTASVQNISKDEIKYRVSTSTPDMHKEIRIEFPFDENATFTDMDTLNKMFNDQNLEKSLEAGGMFSETINLMPGSVSSSYSGDGEDIYLKAGKYTAEAVFSYISPQNGEEIELKAELPLVLV